MWLFVYVSLPGSAVGWSVVCDCDIAFSSSLMDAKKPSGLDLLRDSPDLYRPK